jgi:hypothetical protein
VLVVANQTGVKALGVDETHVYWGSDDSHSVASIPLEGGSMQPLANDEGLFHRGILVDAERAYWIAYSTAWRLRRIAIGGGAPSTVAPTDLYPTDMEMIGSRLLWTDQAAGGRVASVDKTGDNLIGIADGQGTVTGIAVDDDNVYWITAGPNGSVKSAPLGVQSPSAKVLASDLDGSSIAVDATTIYFTDNTTGVVSEMPKAGGKRKDIVTGQDRPYAIAVDGITLYWKQRDNGQAADLMRLARCADQVPTLIAPGVHETRIGRDTLVYFLWAYGEIRRLAK